MPPVVRDIDIASDVEGHSAGLRGLLGVPDGVGPWPGIVVLHEAFGIDDEMRKQVANLAGLGYLALMPDLFSEGGFRRCISATMRAMASGRGRAYADIEAARRAVLANPDCTGKVGVLGFCMGGGFALMTLDGDFNAAAVNYGILPKDLDAAVENACPVVSSYGAQDATLRGASGRLDAALTRAGITHDSKEYAGTGHSFLNERMSGPLVMRPLVRVLGMGPRPEAAADAWRRIDEFFEEHLSH